MDPQISVMIDLERDKKLLQNQYWRLNNLYWVVDEQPERVKFRFREEQDEFYRNLWYWNIIPKARQIGFSTLICIMGLDTALFNNNQSVAIIAHKFDDAETLFRKKVEFPYNNLPDEIKESRNASTRNKRTLMFDSNNSIIEVDTSIRSDTVTFLHISEFAKICKKFQDKAEEIVTGGLPALHEGSMLFIESTSEGPGGYFTKYCKEAKSREDAGIEPNKRQLKLHFFPWHAKKSNRISPDDVEIYPWLEDYFRELATKHNIHLDDEQKAWYANEINMLGDRMKHEHPSTFEECFWESSEGAYYRKQFIKMREENRITNVPYDPNFLVDTAWDIGLNDSTAIWFTQTVGRELHWIDYYENNNEGVLHYIDYLRELSRKHGYRYGLHWAPHDIKVREWGVNAETRWQSAYNLGLTFQETPNIPRVDGIQALRNALDISWFDEKKCKEGLEKLETYQKEFDIRHNKWKDTPRKSDANHAADAARYRAVTWKQVTTRGKRLIEMPTRSVGSWAD